MMQILKLRSLSQALVAAVPSLAAERTIASVSRVGSSAEVPAVAQAAETQGSKKPTKARSARLNKTRSRLKEETFLLIVPRHAK